MRNWEELGIQWTKGDVSREAGSNRTDRKSIGTCQIPHLTNLDKAVAAGLSAAVLAGVNGTSWRVKAQDVGRRYIEKCQTSRQRYDEETNRTLVFQRLLSIRVSTGGVTIVEKRVIVNRLPNGQEYTGTNLAEYQGLVAAALSDMGVPNALEQAKRWKLEGAVEAPADAPEDGENEDENLLDEIEENEEIEA